MVERFTAAMQERAGSQFEEMATTVDALNRTLKESADGLSQTQRDVRDALKERFGLERSQDCNGYRHHGHERDVKTVAGRGH